MLRLILLFVFAEAFNVTELRMPKLVFPNEPHIEVECTYMADFTLLSWFKERTEFFRYKPGAAPTTKSFPVLGIGHVEMLYCGPTACKLKFAGMTEEATGFYRCDVERSIPPFKFASKTAYMKVYGYHQKKPVLEGLEDFYREGEEIKASCRADPDSEIRWFVNGVEDQTKIGKSDYVERSSKKLFLGKPPTVIIQCAEFTHGFLSGSESHKAQLTNDDMPPLFITKGQDKNNRKDVINVIINNGCDLFNSNVGLLMISVAFASYYL